MEGNKRKKPEQIHICCMCGKDIGPGEDFEYIKTKRHTELYLHKKCVGGNRNGRN